MPIQSSVKKLPPDLQWDIDRKILEGDYRSIPELTRWIEGKGFVVTRRTLYRHKRQLEKAARLERLKDGSIVKETDKVSTAQLEWENFYLTERVAALTKTVAKMAKRKRLVEDELFQRYQSSNRPINIGNRKPENPQLDDL
jgi:hypothetical protein